MDGRTDMTKLVFAFRNFAKAPKHVVHAIITALAKNKTTVMCKKSDTNMINRLARTLSSYFNNSCKISESSELCSDVRASKTVCFKLAEQRSVH